MNRFWSLSYVVCSSTTLMAWQIAKKSKSFGYCCYITSNWPDFLCTNRHQLFSPQYNFFAKLIIYIFFCLVQKSVTVCFQSILLVSKRLLIILLSHSKFFIGHCTHPLFLGTFSFAASSRIYYFFAKWTLKDCQQVSCLLQFSIFLVIATSTQSWKKGCQESSWVSKHWLGKKCSQNTLWSYYSRISAIFRLEALKLHKVVDSPFLKFLF